MKKVLFWTYIILQCVFYFPAYIIHEFLHFTFAKLTGCEVNAVNIIPRLVRNEEKQTSCLEFGSVTLLPRNGFASFVSAVAPVLLWVLIPFFLRYIELVDSNVHFSVLQIQHYLEINSYNSVALDLYIFIQLLFGGRLSRQDMKVAFSPMLSLVAWIMIFALIVFGLYTAFVDDFMLKFLVSSIVDTF